MSPLYELLRSLSERSRRALTLLSWVSICAWILAPLSSEAQALFALSAQEKSHVWFRIWHDRLVSAPVHASLVAGLERVTALLVPSRQSQGAVVAKLLLLFILGAALFGLLSHREAKKGERPKLLLLGLGLFCAVTPEISLGPAHLALGLGMLASLGAMAGDGVRKGSAAVCLALAMALHSSCSFVVVFVPLGFWLLAPAQMGASLEVAIFSLILGLPLQLYLWKLHRFFDLTVDSLVSRPVSSTGAGFIIRLDAVLDLLPTLGWSMAVLPAALCFAPAVYRSLCRERREIFPLLWVLGLVPVFLLPTASSGALLAAPALITLVLRSRLSPSLSRAERLAMVAFCILSLSRLWDAPAPDQGPVLSGLFVLVACGGGALWALGKGRAMPLFLSSLALLLPFWLFTAHRDLRRRGDSDALAREMANLYQLKGPGLILGGDDLDLRFSFLKRACRPSAHRVWAAYARATRAQKLRMLDRGEAKKDLDCIGNFHGEFIVVERGRSQYFQNIRALKMRPFSGLVLSDVTPMFELWTRAKPSEEPETLPVEPAHELDPVSAHELASPDSNLDSKGQPCPCADSDANAAGDGLPAPEPRKPALKPKTVGSPTPSPQEQKSSSSGVQKATPAPL